MANNGDFPKVAGRLCIGEADNGADNFVYFKSDYLRDARFCLVYYPPSTEGWFARAASEIERRLSNPATFDIRWLGALHLAAWLVCYMALIRVLRPLSPAAWWPAAAASLWMFTDANWVAYFNSFYSDVPALIGALGMFAAGLNLALTEARSKTAWVVFGIAAILFVGSKSQHGISGFLLLPLFVVFGRVAFGEPARRTRRLAAVVAIAAVVFAGDVWLIAQSPDWVTGITRFNLIFFKVLPASRNAPLEAAELGLAPDDLNYVGMHSYMANSPVLSERWMRGFAQRGSYGVVAKYYLRHPGTAFGFLWRDLSQQAPLLRAPNLSNYRRTDGRPAGAIASRMASWSRLRGRLLARWPWHMIVWYGLVLLAVPWLTWRDASAYRRAWLWSIFFTALIGMAEFLIASLCDSLETYRHLLLFHLFTDFTFFAAFVSVIAYWCMPNQRKMRERLESEPSEPQWASRH